MRAPRGVNLDAPGREPCRQRVDRAAYLIELADAQGIELRNLKALAAAFGDQTLPVQQMQRVGDRLARHPELFRKFALPDAVPRWQRAVRDRLKDPRVDLIDQVGGRVERDHGRRPVWNTEFRILKLRPGWDGVKWATPLILRLPYRTVTPTQCSSRGRSEVHDEQRRSEFH